MVIAIISLLSSLTIVSLSGVKARARDAQRMATFYTLRNALQLYYSDHGDYPPNQVDGRACDFHKGSACLDELVTSGFMSELPSDPPSPLPRWAHYYYYNYTNVAVIETNLETKKYNEIPNNCTFTMGTWCDAEERPYHYCLCLEK